MMHSEFKMILCKKRVKVLVWGVIEGNAEEGGPLVPLS